MNKPNLSLLLNYELRYDKFFALLCTRDKHGGIEAIAKPLEMVTQTEESSHCIPMETFRFDKDEAIAFMNELWRNGIRPSHVSSSTDLIEAKCQHISDLIDVLKRMDLHTAALLKKIK